ncbi:MAG: OmpA family protein [Sulfurimonas sp.]|nr:OmpA family protein [Sulfurimonas sp.]
MKKLLLIPALLAGSIVVAQDYKYEITPVVGYNIVERNLDLKNQTLVGAEFQYNDCNTFFKPEFSVLYTDADYKNSAIDTDIYRLAINGVHEYDAIGMFTPLSKIGVGYETIDKHLAQNKDSVFVDAGVGAKIPFTDAIALKLEAVYMLKNNDNRWDSNLALLAGINFAFGPKAQAPTPAPAPVAAPAPKPEPVVVPEPVKQEVAKAVALEKVMEVKAAEVCPPKINLHINFKFDSAEIEKESIGRVNKFADFLKCTPDYKAKIIGHTDSIGSEAYNQKLSQKRADAVRNMIIKDGVPSDKITISAKGETEPITTNKTNEGRAENRRIEAELTKN